MCVFLTREISPFKRKFCHGRFTVEHSLCCGERCAFKESGRFFFSVFCVCVCACVCVHVCVIGVVSVVCSDRQFQSRALMHEGQSSGNTHIHYTHMLAIKVLRK